MAATQQAQGGEGSGSRQRRRRDRGGHAGNSQLEKIRQPVTPGLQQSGRQGAVATPSPSGHQGAAANSAKANGAAKVGSFGGGAGQYGGHGHHNGYGVGRGYDDGWGGKGYGGSRDYHNGFVPAPPPWPAPAEEQSLKDLLLQVAPQARIAENTSRLSSKASVNILSKVLSEATQEQGAGATGSSADSGGDYGSHNHKTQPKQEDEEDEETAFMQSWSGLFGRGSPLMNGTLEDPFADVKKRAKVVWKKNTDRSGHRQRYQERKMQKQQEAEGDNGEGDASVVYNASQTQWQAQRPPESPDGQWQPRRPPRHPQDQEWPEPPEDPAWPQPPPEGN